MRGCCASCLVGEENKGNAFQPAFPTQWQTLHDNIFNIIQLRGWEGLGLAGQLFCCFTGQFLPIFAHWRTLWCTDTLVNIPKQSLEGAGEGGMFCMIKNELLSFPAAFMCCKGALPSRSGECQSCCTGCSSTWSPNSPRSTRTSERE